MKIEIIDEPFLFMDTLELLHKHINGIRFAAMWNPCHEPTPIDQIIRERLDTLQAVLDEVCREVDASDPLLKKYFGFVELEPVRNSACLARFLVSAFVDYRSPGFDDTVADILAQWHKMNETGGRLCMSKGTGLQYVCDGSDSGDLFAQIYRLELPAEFRLSLYGALHKFPESLRELAELMRPISLRLEKVLKDSGLLLGEMAHYWMNTPISPLEFLSSSLGKEAVEGAGEHLRLAIGLMSANVLYYGMEHDPGRERPYSYMYIGCCITAKSLLLEHSVALDEAGATLRGLSERKRLEVLHRLAKQKLCGQELAEVLGMDRGNLSRLLSVLYSQGFLKQERENQRVYYRADRDAMQHFFNHAVSLIFD